MISTAANGDFMDAVICRYRRPLFAIDVKSMQTIEVTIVEFAVVYEGTQGEGMHDNCDIQKWKVYPRRLQY